VNPVTHLKLGNPWLMVVLIAQSLDMRFLSFLKENAMHDAIVPLSLFLCGCISSYKSKYRLLLVSVHGTQRTDRISGELGEVSKANNYTKTTGKDFRKFNAFLFA